MKSTQRLFAFKKQIRILQIFADITATYLVISLALVFWPSSEPFQGITVEGGDPPNETGSEDFAIATRYGEVLFARRYGSDAATSIIFMHGVAAGDRCRALTV